MAMARMTRATPMQLLERAIAGLPEDATIEEPLDTLYLALKVGKGMAEIAEGKGLSQEEVEESLKQWLE